MTFLYPYCFSNHSFYYHLSFGLVQLNLPRFYREICVNKQCHFLQSEIVKFSVFNHFYEPEFRDFFYDLVFPI